MGIDKMKVQELRIGNYILQGGEPQQVYHIERRFRQTWMLNDIMFDERVISDHFEPIPITHQWLERFGFNEKDYKKPYIGIDFASGHMTLDFVLTKPKVLYETQTDYVYELQNHRIVHIKWLHHLQNVFHSITDNELKLKTD
jgi:hypothetical protein